MKDIVTSINEGTANPKGSYFIKHNELLDLIDFIKDIYKENGDKGLVIQKKGREIIFWQADPHGYIETSNALSLKNG